MRSPKGIAAWIVSLALLGQAYSLLFLPKTVPLDWDYFNSLSLVVRSAWLSFGVFPLHDPWVLGGVDLLANPQSRVLSPLIVLDLLFSPPVANVLSWTLLSLLGAWGTYRWLRERGCERDGATIGALFFINSSWFGLHFAEGHVAFAPIQLIPWVLFFAGRWQLPRRALGLGLLFVFFLYEGAMYAFGLSIIALIGGLIAGWVPLRPFLGRKTSLVLAFFAIGCLSLALVKLIPLTTFYSGRESYRFYSPYTWTAMWDAFLSPLQSPLRPNRFPTQLRFHEFGNFIGVAGLLAGVLAALRLRARGWRVYLLAGLFLWIGCGWWAGLNPWSLFEKLPVLGNLRVQSRVLILFQLVWAYLVAMALSGRVKRSFGHFLIAATILVIGVVVRNYPFYDVAKNYPRDWPQDLIRSNEWKGTRPQAPKPSHYFEGGWGGLETYEPVAPPSAARAIGTDGYSGEIYAIGATARARINSVSPGRIQILVEGAPTQGATLVLNFNFLDGWRSQYAAARVAKDPQGRISVDVPAGDGQYEIRYAPHYLTRVYAALLFGLLLLLTGAYLSGWFSARLSKS